MFIKDMRFTRYTFICQDYEKHVFVKFKVKTLFVKFMKKIFFYKIRLFAIVVNNMLCKVSFCILKYIFIYTCPRHLYSMLSFFKCFKFDVRAASLVYKSVKLGKIK